MRGPGETQIEADRRTINQKISNLKQKLTKIDTIENTSDIQTKPLDSLRFHELIKKSGLLLGGDK